MISWPLESKQKTIPSDSVTSLTALTATSCIFTRTRSICTSHLRACPLVRDFNAHFSYTNFAPAFKGRYLSSNVNITVLNDKGKIVSVPVGSKLVVTFYTLDIHVISRSLREVHHEKVRILSFSGHGPRVDISFAGAEK